MDNNAGDIATGQTFSVPRSTVIKTGLVSNWNLYNAINESNYIYKDKLQIILQFLSLE